MNFPIFIARRLGFKPADSRTSSPGVVVGYIGVALAIVIMLLAIAVVNGFKKEIKNKLVGFNSEITLLADSKEEAPGQTSGIRLTDSLRNVITKSAPDAEMALIIRQPAIFKTDSDFQGIILKGLPDSTGWGFYAENLTAGRIPEKSDGSNAVVISTTTASQLGIKAGDKLLTHFFDGNSIRSRNLLVTGIYDTHFHDFDASFAFTPLSMLQHLCHVDSLTGTAIELRGIGIDNAATTGREIQESMVMETISNPDNPMLCHVSTIDETCSQYLNWLDLLDTNVTVIILLMACVASFTLISSLFILILERVNTVGLLKALGATNRQIRYIFIYMAQRLVIRGMIIGNVIALAFVWLQYSYRVIPLDADAYYLNYVPVSLSWHAVAIVDIAVIVISALVLILPSHIIATLSPSTTLRYE